MGKKKKDGKKKMLYMCEWERARGAFSASCMLFVVLSLRAQKEKETENKIPPKVRFLAKGWESFNDVIDAWWMLHVLSVFRGRRWGLMDALYSVGAGSHLCARVGARGARPDNCHLGTVTQSITT